MRKFIITGTDTEIGKTTFSAALLQAMNKAGHATSYWKPVQSGLDGMVDTRTVQKLSGLGDEIFLEEAYVLSEPLSPHKSAEIDGVEIDLDRLNLPETEGGLLVEGAGGLMVPLTRKALFVNQFKRWDLPVILCARAGLGTINHTLLSLEALWSRKIPVHGLVFIGEGNPDNIATIAQLSGEKVLGWLPQLEEVNAQSLSAAFQKNFDIHDFV
ncbi:MAG: dethiobiotin synthase [Alphaproteobacteria bacterium]|nr:dethiobiotin synthase [Alphaproteobacteria bacterium]|tara:strand:- start:22621 stop:23259 length:639 start_codon:yes stop_codon:yes gene_type:complete